MSKSNRKGFINGFRSWLETHHECVAWITLSFDKKYTVAKETHDAVGTHGLYELAEEWTNEWEKSHKGVDWDERDYWTEIEDWLRAKNTTNEGIELWYDKAEDLWQFIDDNPHIKWWSIVVEDEKGKNVQWIARQNCGTLFLREGEYLYSEPNRKK